MLALQLTAQNSSDLSLQNTGLGNVMYQLAFQYSTCKKYNLIPNYYFLKKFIEKLETFGLKNYNIFRNFSLSDDEFNNFIELKESSYYSYDTNLIENILKNKNTNLLISNSYLQTHNYFHEYQEDIQNLFEPDETFISEIMIKYPNLFNKDETNICIQMRLKWNSDRVNLDNNFILECLNYFQKLELLKKKVNLWIFSDNIDKAKDILLLLSESYNIIYVDSNKYDYEDLWMMSLIDYHIVSFSTFSWWGAYLNKNKNKVILYSNDYYYTFFKNILHKNDTYESLMNNFYPSDWICINKNYILLN